MAKSTKTPCPKHANTAYGAARYVHLCDACVALNKPVGVKALDAMVTTLVLDPGGPR